MIEERIVKAKALGLKVGFGGTNRWLEIRKVERERKEESPSTQQPTGVPYYPH